MVVTPSCFSKLITRMIFLCVRKWRRS
jgi:hypothetical protein